MDPSRSRFRWQAEWPLLALLLSIVAVSAVAWNAVPERMPVHWNAAGEVDRYGGRGEGLLLFPLIGAVIYFALLVAPRIDPARANYAAFSGPFYVVRLAALAMVLALQLVVVAAARGVSVNMGLIVPLMVGALFVVMGAMMPRFKHNWFVGIRTPWTLTSEYSWRRTHEVGGKVFIANGLLMMAAAALREPWFLKPAIGFVVGSSIGLVIFSYMAWRRDPDRRD